MVRLATPTKHGREVGRAEQHISLGAELITYVSGPQWASTDELASTFQVAQIIGRQPCSQPRSKDVSNACHRIEPSKLERRDLMAGIDYPVQGHGLSSHQDNLIRPGVFRDDPPTFSQGLRMTSQYRLSTH